MTRHSCARHKAQLVYVLGCHDLVRIALRTGHDTVRNSVYLLIRISQQEAYVCIIFCIYIVLYILFRAMGVLAHMFHQSNLVISLPAGKQLPPYHSI